MIKKVVAKWLDGSGWVREWAKARRGYFVWNQGDLEIWVFHSEVRVWDNRYSGTEDAIIAIIPFCDPDFFVRLEGLIND